MFINLAKQGVKRVIGPPEPDIMRVREYHPEVLERYDNIIERDWKQHARITSGYRDRPIGKVKNSPHMFAIALDVSVGHPLRQIEFAKIALRYGFTRAGLYPRMGIVHIDIADADWIRRYHGAQYWVSVDGHYWGKRKFEQAAEVALKLATLGGD